MLLVCLFVSEIVTCVLLMLCVHLLSSSNVVDLGNTIGITVTHFTVLCGASYGNSLAWKLIFCS